MKKIALITIIFWIVAALLFYSFLSPFYLITPVETETENQTITNLLDGLEISFLNNIISPIPQPLPVDRGLVTIIKMSTVEVSLLNDLLDDYPGLIRDDFYDFQKHIILFGLKPADYMITINELDCPVNYAKEVLDLSGQVSAYCQACDTINYASNYAEDNDVDTFDCSKCVNNNLIINLNPISVTYCNSDCARIAYFGDGKFLFGAYLLDVNNCNQEFLNYFKPLINSMIYSVQAQT